ncbi:beta-N-acetylhexosaminidase [Virgibacillus halodenitrificans]|uniref:beta-N-acetylhexosaminidase n=1 Tax=Virgibacillus halodenitrificans TaxID=1482 RepID=UPI0024C01016|nr:beta-N-acetylhexosaminidase [Virgibacillus halodenitrificans]WHX26128.1 beta-N-acetylhexosaminidase [Virgibacillus halodenitrificans]
MKIHLYGDVAEIHPGVSYLQEDLGFQMAEDGYPIEVTKHSGSLLVKNEEGKGEIMFQEKIHFYRALGLWLENFQEEKINFEVKETPNFSTSGAMLDASRNAVMDVEGIKAYLRKMAAMGLNMLMMYTEDTYEVKEYPYFGYMRGRYTEDELRDCDMYAAELGIEMVPCVQTLAHLTEALKWDYAKDIKDTSDILLVGNSETYLFLERIVSAATKPFRSKRVHIGMDEAHQLGLGKYLEENGYEQRFNIMNSHLKEVVSICKSLKLEPMIWSDMYFRLGSKFGGYYDVNAEIPEEVIASIPDTQLVYWDYYHEDKDFYTTFIKKHKELGSTPLFAGGAWTWNGISPNYGKGIATTDAALTACKEEGVNEVIATMWGDNGAETPLTTALPVLQWFAEHTYRSEVTEEHVSKRFEHCIGGSYADFMLLNQLDETPGVAKDNLQEANPSKFLLWQDVLIGLFDENIKGLGLKQHYEALAERLGQAKERNSEWAGLFDFYESLAYVLHKKSELGIEIKSAYDSKDKEGMKVLAESLKDAKEAVDTLRKKHRSLWLSMNKPFGWEVLDIRYGGVIIRMETALYRLKEWIANKTDRLDELEEERLYFEGVFGPERDGTIGRSGYDKIVSASPLSGV